MGRKIFVSYKYADYSVKNLNAYTNSKVRDYVTELENLLKDMGNIYKGEEDDEDLSKLEADTIWTKLKDRIYDSSLTIVFISPEMKEEGKKDRDQWIPWEISYSLKEIKRKNKNGDPVTSRSNAMIAIVLPDVNDSYTYYLEKHACCSSICVTHHTGKLFEILKANKFNLKDKKQRTCDNTGKKITIGDCSYIEAVKWSDFVNNPQKYIDDAYERQSNIEGYYIQKEL